MLPTTRRTLTPRTVPGIRNELDRLFENFFEESRGNFRGWTPATDLYETNEEFVVEMELPGFTSEHIDVSVDQGTLTISGRREMEERSETTYHLRERGAGRFSRSFSLPASIAADDVNARFDEGVLRVRMPKAAQARTRKIEVDVG